MKKKFFKGQSRRAPRRAEVLQKPKQSWPRQWLQAMRTHPLITGLWSFLVALGVLSGLAATLSDFWGPFWPTQPEISVSLQDPELPFALPFTVFNKSVVFGIKNAIPICWFYQLRTSSSNMIDFGLAALKENQDIPVNDLRTFYCPIATSPDDASAVKLKLSIDYQEDIFGFLWHRRATGDVFEWDTTTQGGVWIDKGYFPPDPKRPKGTIWNP